MWTLEIALRVTLLAHVSLVTKDRMKDRVDYRLTVYLHPRIRGGRG